MLETSDGSATRTEGLLRTFTAADRAGRAGAVLLGALGLAGMFIPIPIIHLLAIPIILVAGAGVAGRQLMSVARLAPLRIACPKCGAVNRVGGGLGYRQIDRPIERMCEECRRGLQLRIEDR